MPMPRTESATRARPGGVRPAEPEGGGPSAVMVVQQKQSAWQRQWQNMQSKVQPVLMQGSDHISTCSHPAFVMVKQTVYLCRQLHGLAGSLHQAGNAMSMSMTQCWPHCLSICATCPGTLLAAQHQAMAQVWVLLEADSSLLKFHLWAGSCYYSSMSYFTPQRESHCPVVMQQLSSSAAWSPSILPQLRGASQGFGQQPSAGEGG